MKLLSILAALTAVATLAACPHPVTEPVTSFAQVPPDGAAVCARHCATMALDLSAVVLVSDRIGCVCAPHPAAPPGPPGVSVGGAAAATAISMIVDDEAAAAAQQRQQQLQRQRQQQQQQTPPRTK